jgi:Na+/H+ antiporter NhaD/arsenite permease-like protein
METTVLLIFGVVYLGMILGGLPFLQLDRTGIALLGAIALIGAGALSLEEAWEAVHVPTLILLFAFMVVDAAQRRGVTIDWKRHARTGIPVTLATMAISWVYLWFRVLH